MTSESKKKLLKFLLIGGFATLILIYVYQWIFLGFACESILGICVISSFLIQSPAYIFKIFAENLFNTTLTSNNINLVFITAVPFFWFIVGLLLGYITYLIKIKGKK